MCKVKSTILNIFIFFLIPFSVGAETDNSSVPNFVLQNRKPNMESVPPGCDEGHPKATGVILYFKSWPLNEDQEGVLFKKMENTGLEKAREVGRFKSRIYEWSESEWQDGAKALDVCKKLSDLSFLDYCEPEYFSCPATGFIRKKSIENS